MKAKHTDPPDPAKLYQYLWEEFKYRHDLIWQRIFQFTTAIVLISIIPYIRPEIVGLLGDRILLAPMLAIFLALFVLLVIWHELRLFENIATALMRQQNELLGLKHNLKARRPFGWFVMGYLIILLGLSIANFRIVQSLLIPKP
jgi:hypothetical protein